MKFRAGGNEAEWRESIRKLNGNFAPRRVATTWKTKLGMADGNFREIDLDEALQKI